MVGGILILLIGFVAFDLQRYMMLEGLDQRIADLFAVYEARPILFTFLFVLAYIILAALSLPGATVFTLTAGAIFGLPLGAVLSILASTTGATLAFVVGRYLFRDWFVSKCGPRLGRVSAEIAKDGGYYLFPLRLIPLFPFLLTNILMAVSPMKTRTFACVTLLGIIPGTLVYALAGLHLDDVEGLRAVMSPLLIAGFALLGLLPLAIKKLVESRKRPTAS